MNHKHTKLGSTPALLVYCDKPNRTAQNGCILLFHGLTANKEVPQYARQFHTRLKAHYADYDDRFTYIEYPNSGHFMEATDWEIAWTKTVNWFESYLL